MRVTFKAFDSKMASREKLFKAALDFANKIPREDLINITHTEDHDNIVVSVWYYTAEPERGAEIKAKRTNDMATLPSGSAEVVPPPITRTRPTMAIPRPVFEREPEPEEIVPIPPPPPEPAPPAAAEPDRPRRLSDQIRRIMTEPRKPRDGQVEQ